MSLNVRLNISLSYGSRKWGFKNISEPNTLLGIKKKSVGMNVLKISKNKVIIRKCLLWFLDDAIFMLQYHRNPINEVKLIKLRLPKRTTELSIIGYSMSINLYVVKIN